MPRAARFLSIVALALWAGTGAAWAGKGQRQGKPIVRRIYDPSQEVPPPTAFTVAGVDHLSHDAYRQIRDASVELMRRYPPSESFYIGLGRSPAPLIGFIRNLERGGRRTGINFPAGGLQGAVIDGELQTSFEAYFEHFIPAQVLFGEGNLVIIDRSVSGSGSSIHAVKVALERYLGKIGSKAKVVGLSYSDGAPKADYGLDFIDTHPFPEIDDTNTSRYEDHVAEYTYHSIDTTTKPTQVQRRGEYDTFLGHMRSRQVADDELDVHLRQWTGD